MCNGCLISISWLWICLSEKGVKYTSWPWVSPFQGWGSLTMAFFGQFAYICCLILFSK